MLNIKGLSVSYGGIAALSDVDIVVEPGETAILIGANGAGKSSLINSILGLAPVAAGSIAFDKTELRSIDPAKRARLGIGFSPEGRRVFASMSVSDNIRVGCWGGTVTAQRYEWLLETFPLLRERRHQPAGYLSGGEQQIVALARALSMSPRLLLLDEPFLGLAPIWVGTVSKAIRELQNQGLTILMAEQMARPALKLAHRGYVIRGGRIRRSGMIDEIKEAALAEEYL
jgi:branched-chain amino acid transport system ATP-binding protein